MVAAIGGVRLMFEAIGSEYLGYTEFIRMGPSVEGVKIRLLDAPPEEIPPVNRSTPTLDRIHQRGFLRVGYTRDSLPWAFQNEAGQVVGFDIDMVSLLASEIGVSLELVLTDRADLGRLLNSGYLDTVVGGIALTTERMELVWFSAPYMDATLGFVVPDYRREEFSSREAVKALKTPRLAVLDIPYYRDKLRAYLPQAEQIVVDSVRDFFRDEADRFDALVLTAQTGSAWCMIYPKFSVAVPLPDTMAVPFAFPVARGDQDMLAFLTSWIELKTKDGTIDGLFDHWILGEATKRREPRWSVIRDVLGWVD
jgi:ABC-type amino acid transport substrate-binding protein